MGKIMLSLSNVTERRLREYAEKRYGKKKGALAWVADLALTKYLDSEEADTHGHA